MCMRQVRLWLQLLHAMVMSGRMVVRLRLHRVTPMMVVTGAVETGGSAALGRRIAVVARQWLVVAVAAGRVNAGVVTRWRWEVTGRRLVSGRMTELAVSSPVGFTKGAAEVRGRAVAFTAGAVVMPVAETMDAGVTGR